MNPTEEMHWRENLLWKKLTGELPIYPRKRRLCHAAHNLAEDIVALRKAGQLSDFGLDEEKNPAIRRVVSQQRMYNALLGQICERLLGRLEHLETWQEELMPGNARGHRA